MECFKCNFQVKGVGAHRKVFENWGFKALNLSFVWLRRLQVDGNFAQFGSYASSGGPSRDLHAHMHIWHFTWICIRLLEHWAMINGDIRQPAIRTVIELLIMSAWSTHPIQKPKQSGKKAQTSPPKLTKFYSVWLSNEKKKKKNKECWFCKLFPLGKIFLLIRVIYNYKNWFWGRYKL